MPTPVPELYSRCQCAHTGGQALRVMIALARAGGRSVGVDSRSFGDAGGPLRLRGLSAAEPAPPLAAKGFQGDGL